MGSGYGGKGFKFNEEEEDATREARKAQARAAGREMGLSDDEEEKENDDDIKLVRTRLDLLRHTHIITNIHICVVWTSRGGKLLNQRCTSRERFLLFYPLFL